MLEKSRLISLPDGRTLGFARFGDPVGHPIFFMHGFPGTRLEAELLHEAARSVGVSVIAPDRPGFGLSEFQPGRVILDWPQDVAALADALGIERFHIVGGSAGCPYALACALRLRARVAGLAIIAGLAPPTEGEVVREMGLLARLGFHLANRAPSAFEVTFGLLARLVGRFPNLNFHLNDATPPDKRALSRPRVRAILEASVREAFRQGPAGPVHELALLARHWGFELEEIVMPLHVWHGQRDGVVPSAMGELLASKMPGAQLKLVAEEGHVSLPVAHSVEILRALVHR